MIRRLASTAVSRTYPGTCRLRLAILRLVLADLRSGYGDLIEPQGERKPWRWDGPITRMRYVLMPRRLLLHHHFRALDQIDELRERLHRREQ